MSSLSNFVHDSPRTRQGQPPCLDETLAILGFQQARQHTYEWLMAYPDARPLLEAIQTCFNPQSVLSESETAEFSRITDTRSPLCAIDALFAASPLEHTTVDCQPDQKRQAQLKSAREHLALLTFQRDALKEAIRNSPMQPRTSACLPDSQCSKFSASDTCFRIRSMLQHLQHHLQRDVVSISFASDFKHYTAKERIHSDIIAAFTAEVSYKQPHAAQHPQFSSNSHIKKIVQSYADLRANHCKTEAQLKREIAIVSSLNSNDGEFLDMTAASMRPHQDWRVRGITELEGKAKRVSEEASDFLWKKIEVFTLSDSLLKQKSYIDSMDISLRAFIEQRLRIHCFQAIVDLQSTQRNLLEASLQKIISQSINPIQLDQNAATNLSSLQPFSALSLGHMSLSESGLENLTSSNSVQEDDNFSSTVDELLTLLGQFLETTSSKKGSLELQSHPRYSGLVKKLEEVLSGNSIILDALIRKRATIVNGSASPMRQSNHSWISKINSKSSSPLSHNCPTLQNDSKPSRPKT